MYSLLVMMNMQRGLEGAKLGERAAHGDACK
jgi:hypothetical protein